MSLPSKEYARPSDSTQLDFSLALGNSAPARLAAIILVLTSVEICLSALLPGGFLREIELALGARFLILSYSTAVLIGVVWTIVTGVRLILRLSQNKWALGKWPDFCIKATTFVLLFLYVLSWATFWQVGKFLNVEAFRFWLIQPLQVFHWVDMDVGATVILTTVACCTLLYLLPRWWSRLNAAVQDKLIRLIRATFVLCMFAALLGEIYQGRTEEEHLRSTMLYSRTRDQRSTPLAHFIGNIRSSLFKDSEDFQNVKPPRLILRNIIPMDKYINAIHGSAARPWNVIVIIVESLRADQLRAYGSIRDTMPTVEALARESRVFTNTRSQSSQTSYAVFAPLSSHYPLRSPGPYSYSENLRYPRVLIHNVLKKVGYRTAVFSSSNENWEGMIHYLQSGDIDRLFYASLFKGPTYSDPGDTRFANWVLETQHAGSVDDRFTVDEAIQWIDQLDSSPFFMYMNLQNSHLPYRVPDDFPRRFSPKAIDFTIRFGYFPKDKINIVKDVYADSLSYVDAQIARLFRHLRGRGLWDKTLIVVTGDHGQAFYEHGFSAHAGPIYDEVLKVPLVIRAPGLSPALDSRPAQHIDVPPSILALLGLPSHPSFQGKSLFESKPDPKRPIFMVTQNVLARQYGIVRADWKLIYDEQEQNYQLFNLASDPAERINLARLQTTTLRDLAARLHGWRSAQIKYYSDTNWHTREYPPIIED